MTRNLKGGVGPFKIFHIGGMAYTVERDGKVLDTVEHISNAYRVAGQLQAANLKHDDDMFDGDEREEVDRQAVRFDHARDHRKQGD